MKHTIRRSAAALAIAGLAIIVAGCGSDSNRTESYSALVSKANAICVKVGAATDAAVAAKQYDKLQTASDDALKQLKALTPPSELKESYTAYLDAQTKSIDTIAPVIAALKSGDQAAYQTAAAATEPATAAAKRAALAAGLKSCAT